MKRTRTRATAPIISIVGASGSGKTTLLEKLIPELRARGFRVGTIKHHMHHFELDRPGKDSWRHKHSGATATILSSPYQIGLLMDVEYDHSPEELATFLAGVDLILAEGYKRGRNRKLEVFRSDICDEPLCKGDSMLLALVSNEAIDIGVPRFSPDEPKEVADFLVSVFTLAPSSIQHAHNPSGGSVSGDPENTPTGESNSPDCS